ncbi:oxygen-regulated protein 1-like, partial [Silurus asotus]
MSEASALQKAALQEHPPGTGHTVVPSRQPYMSVPFASRHVCFYKSGDTQFSGLQVIINNRTFKTFEALLDSLSKRVPLPFGVRTITTPSGHTSVSSLDQLHHGHSYICSDKRTVKPIDLEQARRKPPPWYHARPVSNRRQREKQNSGPRNTKWNENAALLHTPKRLVVFRNGDPEVKHTLLLQKKTTQSFEALLDRIAEVMCFPVRRLHTPDGRRVDGLPALIMCSGILVAAGREPFRKRNYDVQKPFTPTWLPAKSVGRLHPVTKKKKSMTSTTKSLPFSPSSERFIVNQLHNSFAESAYYPTGSVEIETGHLQESVAGTDTVTCMDNDNNEYICMPSDDDIEKTFRVNQDGSMTIEMKVRLTIKEEETVHWTTTLSRQSVTSQMKSDLDLHSDLSAASTDQIGPDVSAIQRCPEEYNNVSSNKCVQTLYEEMMKGRAEESIKIKDPLQPLSEQKLFFGETESQDIVHRLDTPRVEQGNEQEHWLVRQFNERPVPKPRSTCLSQMQANIYKSADILQIQDSGQERVLHIYEQQTCQNNFFANTEIYAHEINTCDAVLSASSTMIPSSSKDLESVSKPATAHDSLQTLDNFLSSKEHQPLCKRKNNPKIKNKPSNIHTSLTKAGKTFASNVVSAANMSKKRKKIRVSVKKRHSSHIFSLANRKESKINIMKEIRKIRNAVFNQAEAIRGMTVQCRAKSVKKLTKDKRTNLPISHKSVSYTLHKSLQMQSPPVEEQCSNSKYPAEENIYQGELSGNTSPNQKFLNVSTNKCTLQRQSSMQEEQATQDLKETSSLPAPHYSSSVLNKYVEHWLQTSEAETAPDQNQAPSSKSVQELEITCATPRARLASKEKYTTFPRNMPNLSKKGLVNSSQRSNILPRGSGQDSSLLSQMNTFSDTKLSESNISMSMLLPMNLSSKKNHGQIVSIDDTSSPNKSSVHKTLSQENVELSRNISLNNTQLTSRAVLDNSVSTLSSKQEIIQLTQYVKKDENKEEPLYSAYGFANNHVKRTSLSRDPSSEKTLTSQHSIEQIPKNNTLSKASLFSTQGVEKTAISKNAAFQCKPKHSAMTKGSKCTIPQGFVGSCENCAHTFLSPLSSKEKQVFTVKMAVRPDMRHVLDELCHSINSLREATKHKQRSCLEKSNSMPDFSSHLATTFGSSSRVLLAFLSVMTLRDGLENLNVLRLTDTSLSCSEALLMLQSLKEMAAIEDAEQLLSKLNSLQKSASNQLLQSWKGFQNMSSTTIRSNVTPECTREGSYNMLNSEEEAIQRLMEELGVPDRVREELAALHIQEKEIISGNQVDGSGELYESLQEVNRYTESDLSVKTLKFSDCVFEDINAYVTFVIKKAVYEHSNSGVIMQHSSCGTEKEVVTHEQERNSCPTGEKQQADCILDSNICENILEENQQRPEKNDIRHKEKQETYARQEINMEEIKDRPVCEQRGVKQGRIISKDESVAEDYIIDTKYSQPLDSNIEMKEVKDLRNTSKMHYSQMYPKLDKSNDGLDCSEEEKSSLEEETSGEEHIKFFENQVSDKGPASGLQQKYSMVESEAKQQSDELLSQAHMQLHNKMDSANKNPGQPEMQTTLLAVCLERETRHQPEEIYSEEQQAVVEAPECYRQENIDNQKECSIKKAVVQRVKVKKKNSLVAELISNLETCTQRPSSKREKSVNRFVGHTEVSDIDNLNNVSLKGKFIDTASKAHLSSLSFSYDSRSSSLAQEPERSIQANRVKFIRDLFLAKSQSRPQNGQRQLHSPNSDLSDSQPESTDSGGNWSQETSSGEDDSSRLVIAKGFVRRTIERLYGRGNSSSVCADKMSSPSNLKATQRKGPGRTNVSSLASYHETCNEVTTDVSYFSATNTSDLMKSSTACVTLNEQVRSGDANLIDKGHWKLAENQICECAPELQKACNEEKNSNIIYMEQEQQSGQDDASGTPPKTKLKKSPRSSGSKFTYFNLPNASDSELEPEEKMEVKAAPETQKNKAIYERKTFLPAFSPPVLQKADNKVHPLTDATTPAVVAQPIKRQHAQTGITKQSAEPDALEMVFVFCGQHCPIL